MEEDVDCWRTVVVPVVDDPGACGCGCWTTVVVEEYDAEGAPVGPSNISNVVKFGSTSPPLAAPSPAAPSSSGWP